MSSPQPPIISVMLAVPDAVRAVEWYERALGAKQLWNLGSVVGLDIQGAAFFVGEPSNNGWESPEKLGMPRYALNSSVTIRTHSSRARSRPVQRRAVTGYGCTRRPGDRTARAGSWILSGTSGSSATDRRSLAIRASRPGQRRLPVLDRPRDQWRKILPADSLESESLGSSQPRSGAPRPEQHPAANVTAASSVAGRLPLRQPEAFHGCGHARLHDLCDAQ